MSITVVNDSNYFPLPEVPRFNERENMIRWIIKEELSTHDNEQANDEYHEMYHDLELELELEAG